MIVTRYLEFETEGNADIIDITEETSNAVRESGANSGAAIIFVPGATGAVTTIEHEPGLVEDLKAALERWAPMEMKYAHDQRWGDGNGHAHIRASLLGPSLAIPFDGHELMLGTWQQIIFIDMDNRPRKRRVIVQIIGE
ncbi:MAG TPA: secondary thiamine-phosphate synthase enzyme YjbQ [Methanotrichaceae archaeon]|nr:secondary thiamine-phosphate synthase enzyme YjbQ [Methanotrichaceae archaeon]